jgi:hypothetical protein
MYKTVKKYIVAYTEYQHADLGDDDAYDGWLDSYTIKIFFDKTKAKKFLASLKKDRFVKNSFMAMEIDDEEVVIE